jgi:hypothetical protein
MNNSNAQKDKYNITPMGKPNPSKAHTKTSATKLNILVHFFGFEWGCNMKMWMIEI